MPMDGPPRRGVASLWATRDTEGPSYLLIIVVDIKIENVFTHPVWASLFAGRACISPGMLPTVERPWTWAVSPATLLGVLLQIRPRLVRTGPSGGAGVWEQNGECSGQSWAGRPVGQGTGGGWEPQGGPLCSHGCGSLCCDGAQRALRWPPASPCGHDRHRRPSQLTASLPARPCRRRGHMGGVLLLIASVAGSWPDLCAHQEWPRGGRLLPARGSPRWSSRARPVGAGPTAAPLIAPGGSPPRGSDRPSPWGGVRRGWAAADWGAGGGDGVPGTRFSPLWRPYQAQLHSCGIRPSEAATSTGVTSWGVGFGVWEGVGASREPWESRPRGQCKGPRQERGGAGAAPGRAAEGPRPPAPPTGSQPLPPGSGS